MEGVEGAGKTTLLPVIEAVLRDAGHDVLMTREPGGTPLSETLRDIMLDARREHMAPDTEMLLMFAARAEHLAKAIRPALAAGRWVLCDRFTDATYAYQGAGRELGMDRVATLEDWVQGDLRPDLTIILDVPLAVSRERVGRRAAADRFEQENDAFFERVRQAYHALANADARRYRIIDTSGELDATRARLAEVLTAWLAT